MQIRELDLRELFTAYDVLVQLRPELSYNEFEDLIYDMKHMEYKMLGIFEGAQLITYAGVAVQTNLSHKRHLHIYDLITDTRYKTKNYSQMMFEYLHDYAKIAMCENMVFASDISEHDIGEFCVKNGCAKKQHLFVRSV
ncbi:GNAT family N-acetyltransferase [bacterium]|nr:GNAT family N-acetyltransferase [bacterium]MBU1990790.1 GNAT family N-acetyltransferase [bacterium]